jgi:ammonium transporter, Amt family
VASALCYTAVQMKQRFGYDDALDAFGVHGVGGIIGALLTGVFCFMPVVGLTHGGGAGQLLKQAIGVGATIVFAVVGTLVIGYVLKATIGLRATDAEERDGLDISVHGERAYHQAIAS